MVEIPTICRYCGGAVHLVPAAKVYGPAAAKRLGLEREKFYQCQNCNARVGCHMTGAPHSFRKSHIISIDALSENSGLYEETLAA